MAEEKNKVIEEFKKAEAQIIELAQGVESLKEEEKLTKNVTTSLTGISNTLNDLVDVIKVVVESLNKTNITFDKSTSEVSTLINSLLDSINKVGDLESKLDSQEKSLEEINTKLGYLRQVQTGIKKNSK
jgi:DNA repair ATPase RecN|tara:strand:- start:331 stop:717 length:387 start_codon:yes stop_codon:yes gene_type:complete